MNVLLLLGGLVLMGFVHDWRVRSRRKKCEKGLHRWRKWRAVDTTYYGHKDIWERRCTDCGALQNHISTLHPKAKRVRR